MRFPIKAGFLAAAVGIVATVHVGHAASGDATGSMLYQTKCAACHGVNGRGFGPFPPLAGNPVVTSADTRDLISTVLFGKTGPISTRGKIYGGNMPAWRTQLTDSQIAQLLTYTRSAWGNSAPPVSREQVAAIGSPMMASGAQLYADKCAGCHGVSGKGSSSFPPLSGNAKVTAADPRSVIATIVNGRSGPLTVNGNTYNGKMPPWRGRLSNVEIAAVATYIRTSWANRGSAVTEEQVAAAGPSVSSSIGLSIYTARCELCHGANGRGRSGVPALARNPDVVRPDPTGVIATIEHGGNSMPSWSGQLSDADIAAVATYIRSTWGNKGAPVTVGDVISLRFK